MAKKTTTRVLLKSDTYNPKEVEKIIKVKNKKEVERDLEKFANNFLLDAYGMELTIPIKVNGRLKTTLGYFRYMKSKREAIEINMQEHFMACALLDGAEGLKAILSVLKHELIHYVCFMQGEPYNDGDAYFESELARHNSPGSYATNSKKIVSEQELVYYELYDLYHSPVYNEGKPFLSTHTVNPKQWHGKRIGYKVLKKVHKL